MDVRILGISTALLCSAYAMPTTPAHVDFRGVISGADVGHDGNTPPVAARGAMKLYIESEQPAEIENLLMVHNQLESGTRFGSTVGGDEPRLLAGLVIDSSKRSNQLSETV